MGGEGLQIEGRDGSSELQNKKDDLSPAKASSGKKRKQREFAFPAMDRPARERKSIERLIVSPDKEVKEFKIPKGPGTALKDIPNVVFKLSKRKGNDEVVRALHRVLFSKTAKHVAKTNILQFSGFVWSENEEKDKARVRERLEKLVKESLVQISDLLDLSSVRSLKKEDAVLKVFEFLESPYKTSDKLAEEARKSKKGKKSKKTPVKGSKKKVTVKSPRKSTKGAIKRSRAKKEVSDQEDESDAPDFEDDVEEEPEDKSDDDYEKETSRSTKKRKRKLSKEEPVQDSGDNEEIPPKKKKPIEAKRDKEKSTSKAKREEKKPKAKADDVKEPSNEALQEAVGELLENADFSKVTFIDVMKQLGEKFNTDLTHRKAHLKALIQEEIQKLVAESDNEDEEGTKPVQDSGDNEEIPPKKKKPIKEAKRDKEKSTSKTKREEKKPKAKADDVKEPSNEALQDAIRELLENADFRKVTFIDVMKQLGEKFNTDLTHRKAHLKTLIQEEKQKLVSEGDIEDEEGDNEDEEGKDEDKEADNDGEIDDNEDKSNREDGPEEQEDAPGGDPKADNEDEDGDEHGVSDGDKEDSDDEKPSGEGGGDDGKSAENKAEDEVEGDDAKVESEHVSEAEEDSTEKA